MKMKNVSVLVIGLLLTSNVTADQKIIRLNYKASDDSEVVLSSAMHQHTYKDYITVISDDGDTGETETINKPYELGTQITRNKNGQCYSIVKTKTGDQTFPTLVMDESRKKESKATLKQIIISVPIITTLKQPIECPGQGFVKISKVHEKNLPACDYLMLLSIIT
jgi:hypothetical protein